MRSGFSTRVYAFIGRLAPSVGKKGSTHRWLSSTTRTASRSRSTRRPPGRRSSPGTARSRRTRRAPSRSSRSRTSPCWRRELNEAPGRLPEDDPDGRRPEPGADADRPALGSSVTFAPGVGGPRDYERGRGRRTTTSTTSDEGHFVPPEPPPLPEADVTAKFAWLAVVGGPVLMLVAVLLQWDMTWWLTTLCVGGFLGGFATLVARMPHDDDEDDDPGRGAVV